MKRFRILSFKTAPHVRWVVKEKTSKKADHFTGFCQGGTEEKKFRIFSFKTARTVKGGTGEKKVSELFGQTAHFPPVGTEEKKFPKKRTTSPVFVQ